MDDDAEGAVANFDDEKQQNNDIKSIKSQY